MSSGVVSQRTRMTSSPASAALLGGVRVEHDRARRRAGRGVQAARGDLDRRVGVDHRVQQLVELAGSIRATASSREMSPSSTISAATRSAAVAVRFPVRVCRR